MTITLDQPRSVHFDVATFIELERVLNGLPTGVMLDHLKQLNLTVLTAVLWVGMKHDEPDLERPTVRQRLQIFINNGGYLEDLYTQLTDAFDESHLFRDRDAAAPVLTDTPHGSADTTH